MLLSLPIKSYLGSEGRYLHLSPDDESPFSSVFMAGCADVLYNISYFEIRSKETTYRTHSLPGPIHNVLRRHR